MKPAVRLLTLALLLLARVAGADCVAMDYAPAAVVDCYFNTTTGAGAGATLTGGTVSIYKGNSLTQTTTGVTLDPDFDSVVGLNHVRIDTSADGTFYAAGNDFFLIVTAGTVSGSGVASAPVGTFSINHGSTLKAASYTAGASAADLWSYTDRRLTSTAPIVLVMPVASDNGSMTLYPGAAYTVTHGNPADFPIASPDLTNATAWLSVQDGLVTLLSKRGTILNAAAPSQTARFEFTTAETLKLKRPVPTRFTFQLNVQWSTDTPAQPMPIVTGVVNTAKPLTPLP